MLFQPLWVQPPPSTQARLAKSLDRWITSARREGLNDAAIEALVRSVLHDRAERTVA